MASGVTQLRSTAPLPSVSAPYQIPILTSLRHVWLRCTLALLCNSARDLTVLVPLRCQLPKLPYAYNALEPYISEEIMTIHHTKHHQAYINALKTAESSYGSASTAREKIALQAAIKFNGGGHINHSLFWENLAPHGTPASTLQDGPLKAAIDRDFGSFENFKTEINAAGVGVQGSGWVWLVRLPAIYLSLILTHSMRKGLQQEV